MAPEVTRSGHREDSPAQKCRGSWGILEGCVANFAEEVVKGQCSLSVEGLSGQGVDQFGHSEVLDALLNYQLPFLEHVHELDPDQCVLSSLEGFEPQHRPRDPFDCAMVLLDDVV